MTDLQLIGVLILAVSSILLAIAFIFTRWQERQEEDEGFYVDTYQHYQGDMFSLITDKATAYASHDEGTNYAIYCKEGDENNPKNWFVMPTKYFYDVQLVTKKRFTRIE